MQAISGLRKGCEPLAYDQNGNPCLAVDEEIRRRIETKLIVAILSFDLN